MVTFKDNLNRKHWKIILFFDAFFMFEVIKNILELSKKRVNFLHNVDNRWWYIWHKTYIEWIKNELDEMQNEIKENNKVYLEDELWDVFWDYICLLHSLEQEKKIIAEKVFERCYKKFSERIWNNWDGWANWQEVKLKQKEELEKEHNLVYNNK